VGVPGKKEEGEEGETKENWRRQEECRMEGWGSRGETAPSSVRSRTWGNVGG